MKAPDKIYIIPDFIEGLSLERKDYDDEECYIRKDALLEWANEQKEEAEFRYNQADMNLVREVAFDDLIDKLNSM